MGRPQPPHGPSHPYFANPSCLLLAVRWMDRVFLCVWSSLTLRRYTLNERKTIRRRPKSEREIRGYYDCALSGAEVYRYKEDKEEVQERQGLGRVAKRYRDEVLVTGIERRIKAGCR